MGDQADLLHPTAKAIKRAEKFLENHANLQQKFTNFHRHFNQILGTLINHSDLIRQLDFVPDDLWNQTVDLITQLKAYKKLYENIDELEKLHEELWKQSPSADVWNQFQMGRNAILNVFRANMDNHAKPMNHIVDALAKEDANSDLNELIDLVENYEVNGIELKKLQTLFPFHFAQAVNNLDSNSSLSDEDKREKYSHIVWIEEWFQNMIESCRKGIATGNRTYLIQEFTVAKNLCAMMEEMAHSLA